LISYPNEPNASVQVASDTKPGQNLAFKISGEGALDTRQEVGGGQAENEGGESSAAGSTDSSGSAQANNRPGGGLGPPIDAPDPLQKYRWYILGGFAAVLVVGGIFVASRQQAAARAAARPQAARMNAEGKNEEDEIDHEFAPFSATRSSLPRSSMLLEGLKEELFQLEVDRRQNKISPLEYEKAKAALDLTLDRALKREAQKA
jgi:hypothetical protein